MTGKQGRDPVRDLESLMQLDPGNRGIHSKEKGNLCSITRNHLMSACADIASGGRKKVGIVTGFYIPDATPPCPETDGPMGALVIARALHHCGHDVIFIVDPYCRLLIEAGLDFYKNDLKSVDVIIYSEPQKPDSEKLKSKYAELWELDYLIAVERPGPTYTKASFREQNPRCPIELFEMYGPGTLSGECLNMRAKSITNCTSGIHHIFDIFAECKSPVVTIGIGDGGNEIGMGTIPWQLIHDNISNNLGGKIACRIATDYTLVAGVSNWAGYAMAAAMLLQNDEKAAFSRLCSPAKETEFLRRITNQKIAVDGVRGYPSMSVDGIDWNYHVSMLDLMVLISDNAV